jgi:hypothetical protein
MNTRFTQRLGDKPIFGTRAKAEMFAQLSSWQPIWRIGESSGIAALLAFLSPDKAGHVSRHAARH